MSIAYFAQAEMLASRFVDASEQQQRYALRWILDLAMSDARGRPTLAPGQGPEARRLLRLVDWERAPLEMWAEILRRLMWVARWRAVVPVRVAELDESTFVEGLHDKGIAASAASGA